MMSTEERLRGLELRLAYLVGGASVLAVAILAFMGVVSWSQIPNAVEEAVESRLPVLVENTVKERVPALVEETVKREAPPLVTETVAQEVPALVDTAVKTEVEQYFNARGPKILAELERIVGVAVGSEKKAEEAAKAAGESHSSLKRLEEQHRESLRKLEDTYAAKYREIWNQLREPTWRILKEVECRSGETIIPVPEGTRIDDWLVFGINPSIEAEIEGDKKKPRFKRQNINGDNAIYSVKTIVTANLDKTAWLVRYIVETNLNTTDDRYVIVGCHRDRNKRSRIQVVGIRR